VIKKTRVGVKFSKIEMKLFHEELEKEKHTESDALKKEHLNRLFDFIAFSNLCLVPTNPYLIQIPK